MSAARLEPLNPELYGVHRFFFWLYSVVIIIWTIVDAVKAARSLTTSLSDWAIGALVAANFVVWLVVGHWYAAKGARNGTTSGRILSCIYGTIWLCAFPIGTALAVYVFLQVGKKWRYGPVAVPA
jgi:hypothetical protein